MSAGATLSLRSVEQVKAVTIAGPLYARCMRGTVRQALEGSNNDHDNDDKDHWEERLRVAHELAHRLGHDADALTESQASRVLHLYLPVFCWCQQAIALHREQHGNRPLVVGISAPQGSGKTTLTTHLTHLLSRFGLGSRGCNAVALSIDDFYLPRAQQQALAMAHPANPLLQVRGNAGTHDVALGARVLQACLGAGEGDCVRLPRYDKAKHGGKGDRLDESEWGVVEAPVHVVLLEGWMLGFEALPPGSPGLGDHAGLAEVNALLPQYTAWHRLVDKWLVLEVSDVSWVHRWRLEAEHEMRRRGKGGMSDEEVGDFVERYMPAYRAYLPGLYARHRHSDQSLCVAIGPDRSVRAQHHD